ncbi:glycerophosphoryl diester phosphodiesterase membrane domain-containing protein [Microlunatus speluncae]|uniref:glycerophosphoryl diester phosphodiesterase membrane domain-containing protein n=1 Tax=Microlunatus speluncae TaxID=2594267 RepID=UPI0012663005|nr:glycerophosphodiester phosphodiesterase [Microlunatus speluncae]
MTKAIADPAHGEAAPDRPPKPLGVRGAIGRAHRTTWRDPLFYLLTLLAIEGLVVVVAIPILRLIYGLVLVQTGLGSIAYDEFATVIRNPLADLTLLLVAVIATAVVLIGFAVIFILADHHQAGRSITPRQLLLRLRATGRKLLHPQGFLVVVYLLLVLPLGQFGLTATLTGKIGVPPFVSEELSKTPSGSLLYSAVMLIFFYLAVRLLFVLPVLCTTEASVWGSFATSWRLTRWRSLRLVLLIGLISVPSTVLLLILAGLVTVPTLITDEAAPDLSPIMAGTGLSVWQIGLFVVTSLVAVMVAQCLTALKRDWLPRLADRLRPDDFEDGATGTPRRRRVLWGLAAAVTVIALLITTVINIGTLTAFDAAKVTQVLAHRGWVDGGVENTLPALRAAKRSGADRVEFDVLQTKDGRFVVMHDTNLRRLAGIDREVKDLTQDELTRITVRHGDQEAKIPSLEQWIETSKELELPQLLEVKLHGAETPDLVPRLLAVLDAYRVTDWYTYHSISRDVVTRLEAARPTLVVGFIVPINFGGIPKVKCDFIVIEEASYDEDFLHQAQDAGYKILVWTVESEDKMRTYLIDGVDGIITDHPDLGAEQERDIADDRGLALRLLDRVQRGLGSV